MPVTKYITVNGQIQGEMRTGEAYRAYALDRMGNVSAQYTNNSSIPTIPMSGQHSLPYGKKVTLGVQPVANQRFMWLGGHGYRQTNATPDVYVRARHYATREAAWTSVDPLWPSEAAYGYVGCSPTSYLDDQGQGLRAFGRPPHWIFDPRINPPLPPIRPPWEGRKVLVPPLPGTGGTLQHSWCCEQIARRIGARPILDAIGKPIHTDKGHTEGNAVAHCTTACLIAREAPACMSHWQRRELGRFFNHEPSIMDHRNNQIGFNLSERAGDCGALCDANRHLLTWLDPKRHNWPQTPRPPHRPVPRPPMPGDIMPPINPGGPPTMV